MIPKQHAGPLDLRGTQITPGRYGKYIFIDSGGCDHPPVGIVEDSSTIRAGCFFGDRESAIERAAGRPDYLAAIELISDLYTEGT